MHRRHAAASALVLTVVAVALLPARADAAIASRPVPPTPAASSPPTAPVPDLVYPDPVVGWRGRVTGEPVGVAADADAVAVLAADEVRVLDARSGALRWRSEVADAYDARPALGADRVVVTGDRTVTLLDRASGAAVARTAFPDPGPAAVAFDDAGAPVVVVASETERWAGVIDADTGRLRWRARFPAETWVAPVVTAGAVFVAGETGHGTLLRAYDLDSGTVRWQVRRGPDSSAPLATDGVVYVGSGTGHDWPRIEALDGRTGRVRWSTPFPGNLGAAIEPARIGDTLYVLDALGTLGAFAVGDGHPRWFQPTGHDVVFARLAAGAGRIAWVTFLDEVVVADAGTGAVVDAWRPHGVPIDLVWGPQGLIQALRHADPARVEGLVGP